MTIIYHLVGRSDWEAARFDDEYNAESLALEGFIHCSKDHAQLFAVAQRIYGGRDDMLVLEVDTGCLTAPVKQEPSRSGEVYPHIYGPINRAAVARVLSLSTDDGGGYYLAEY